MDHLNPPYGGELSELLLSPAAAAEVKAASIEFPSIALSLRAQCDLELLLNGSFSPLRGFMGRRDYDSVLREMRLADHTLWPLPIALSVTPRQAEKLAVGQTLALREPEGAMLAALHVEDLWEPDRKAEAELAFGTQDIAHPSVRPLLQGEERVYVGGPMQGLQLPAHYDFTQHRYTPAELRHEFARRGWRSVAAFQTRNPLHRAHKEMTMRAASEVGAHLLLNPVVGMTKPGDIDHYTRVRCYEAIAQHYPPEMMMLALLDLAMRMGGPREAVLHAIIRKNHGCSHLIVGRDHAGPGNDSTGKPFYGPYAAQEMVARHEEELGIRMIPFQEMVYVRERAQYMPINEVPAGEEVLNISGTELRRRLREGLEIPEWFSYPNVVEELRRAYPGKAQQGITIFFTGLSGAGKSTVANVLLSKFLEIGGRPVTLLDGDIVRQNLSSELGFSREHRDLNILRIGYVASEITKNRGIAICAPIAPYAATRHKVRELIGAYGAFVEVYVSTPLEVCEGRDRKGLYAKARAGLIAEFTGISDPYEPPQNAEITLDTTNTAPDEAAQEILLYLERAGYLA
ncbi:MAG: bifunctional sulfate adenylyltransferase/adenylylsulfate kinase [Candidatus Lambdaproteobacteria bacterium]|nr:bifunctional sulfate adenylyltransferase/adenylylsulfate kinase [Candidatus Lambdaproteobacteria bacterium]